LSGNLEKGEGKYSEESINKVKARMTRTIMKGQNIQMVWQSKS
jgi:hypothetical protein